MATHTLSTTVSRRAMLGGGPVLAALSAVSPAHAAVSADTVSTTHSDPDPDPDAELLRLMALARRRRDEFNASRLEKLARFRAMVDQPDYPRQSGAALLTNAQRAKRMELAERTGYRAAMAHRDRAMDAYVAAARDAFAIPPRTLVGLYAKLRFAARASHEADNGNYDYGDNIWLDIAVADLRRLAAGAAA